MIRSSKKMKLNDISKSECIKSGNFMTSYLHDQTEYTDEMPIASPDALNNEVPVNTINEEEEINNETKENITINSMELNAANSKMKQNSDVPSNLNVNNRSITNHKNEIVTHRGSISGGLTLDKTNKSLKNLILYIKTAYSNSLTSPKWKNFKGLKLQVIEKIRLNNVIWRTWFEQYGTKYPRKKQRPLLCQFAITLEEPASAAASARVALLEGEYWKRRLASITNEYKKWREISRKQIKSTNDGLVPFELPIINKTINNLKGKNLMNSSLSSNNLNNPNLATINYYDTNQQVNYNNISNHQYDFVNNSNNFYHMNNDTNFNNQNILNNNLNYNSQQNSNYYNNNNTTNLQTNTLPTGSNLTNNNNNNNTTNYYHPITSKQVPFSNRCRSPSPGLFQDFDLYNFSSDTLFTTYFFEDQKDPIFGTNPDLFQPDLMHLYPNFDFLDLDLNINDTYSSSNNVNSFDSRNQSFNSQQQRVNTQSTIANQVQSVDNQQQTVINNTSTKNNDLPMYIQSNDSNHQSIKSIAVLDGLTSNHSSSNSLASSNTSNSIAQTQQQSYVTSDSSDLYNFNTLATVAAAQSPNISPNGEIRQRKNNNFIKHNLSGKNLKLSNENHLINQTKMSNSMPQMSLNDNLMLMQQSINNDKLNSNNGSLSRMNSLNQSNAINGSSNTIRNLLALQSPIVPLNNSNSSNNIRLSTGVLSAVGGTLPSGNQLPTRQNSYNCNSNSLISNMQKQSSTSSSPVSSLSSPTNISSPTILESNLKYQQQDNQHLNALLSIGMAAPLQSNQLNTAKVLKQDLMRQKKNSNENPVAKTKRGRKGSNSFELTSHNFDRNPQLQQQLNNTIKNIDLLKEKKEKQPKSNQSKFSKQNQFNEKPSFYIQNYSSNDFSSSQSNLVVNERNSNSNSPVDSPNNNSNSSLYNHSNMIPVNNYNLISSQSINDNTDDYNTMQRVNSSSSLNYMGSSSKLPISNEINTASRTLSRSNSVNSINTINDQVSAEQKRRCNIQHGFDRLQTLVPSLRESKNSKASKAAMLQKTSEYIKELQRARQKRVNDLDIFKKEIEQLSNQISECQNELPANGVSVVGNLNKTEKFEQKFKSYVKERTVDNWRFYLFSIILKPLFDTFLKTLNTSSKEDMERTFYEWQDKFCNLIQLRPIISNGLRQLSKTTSILSDSSKLPEECYTAALTKI